MINLSNPLTDQNPLHEATFVGTLQFAEYHPVTQVFAAPNGIPLIRKWVDVEGDTDQFAVIPSSRTLLKQYLSETLTTGQLILQSPGGVFYILEQEEDVLIGLHIYRANKIPGVYRMDFRHTFQQLDGVDIKAIWTYFDLDKLFHSTQSGRL